METQGAVVVKVDINYIMTSYNTIFVEVVLSEKLLSAKFDINKTIFIDTTTVRVVTFYRSP